jgi:hypothetical protein
MYVYIWSQIRYDFPFTLETDCGRKRKFVVLFYGEELELKKLPLGCQIVRNDRN